MNRLFLLLLLGCGRDAKDDCEPVAWVADADGDGYGAGLPELKCDAPDGYVRADGDCDDTDASISPEASEVCGGGDEDCDGEVDEDDAADPATWYPDEDHDGYGGDTTVDACSAPDGYLADGGDDCDDHDATAFPGAVEICDHTDDDCDGLVDDADPDVTGGQTFYADDDRDGWGGAEIVACSRPSGAVDDDGDCDDTSAAAFPGGVEVCDGLDDDCDGRVDDSATDAPTWYVDGDGDGFGSSAFSVASCDRPAAFSDVDTDCDDGDADRFPGADEWCDEGDDDCDGEVDEDALDASSWYLDVDGDGYADPANLATACTQPSNGLDEAEDCDDTSADVFPGADEVCDDGVDEDCDGHERPCPIASSVLFGNTELGDTWYGAAAGDRAGESLTWLSDADGDGHDEAVIGIFQESTATTHAGAVCVLDTYGAGVSSLSACPAELFGEATEDYAGKTVAPAGDVDGDGTPDLLVGAFKASVSANWAGTAYLVSGPFSTGSLSGATAILLGEGAYDNAGLAVGTAGDVDADGYDDILVGAPMNDDHYETGGVAYLLYGPVSGTLSLSAADVVIGAADLGEQVGSSVLGGDDLDGDGADDFVLGGVGADDQAGVVYLFETPPTGPITCEDADAWLEGELDGDHAGSSVAMPGDTDGDGYADLLVGAAHGNGGDTLAGAAYLVLGPIVRDANLGASAAVLYGDAAGDLAGTSVSGAGDVDGDDRSDFLVGAPGEDSEGTTNGATYLMLGPISGTSFLADARYAKLVPHTDVVESGTSVSGGGDIDGDGVPDLMVGGPDYGYFVGGSGGAFIVSGADL